MYRARLALIVSLFLAGYAATQETHPAARSTPAFDQLKTLAGHWKGTNSGGAKVELSYEVVSNGSVVMERLRTHAEPEMITMYSLEGDRILVTHYCSMGNQPTLETAPLTAASGKFDFSFLRVSGTKTSDEGHMASLSVTIPDKNHLTQVWTMVDHGKSMTDTFNYTRKL
jgi:hypothetical protein